MVRFDLLVLVPLTLVAGALAGGYVGVAIGAGVATRHAETLAALEPPPFCGHLVRGADAGQVVVHVRIPNGTPPPPAIQVTLRNKEAKWVSTNVTDSRNCAHVLAPKRGWHALEAQAEKRTYSGQQYWWSDTVAYESPRKGVGAVELVLDGYARFGG